MTTRVIGRIVALILLSLAEVQAQAVFDGLMERTTESAKCIAHDRLNQRIDESIDKAINETEDTVKCVPADRECLRRAQAMGKKGDIIESMDACIPTAS